VRRTCANEKSVKAHCFARSNVRRRRRIRSRVAFLSISPEHKHPRRVLYRESRCTSKDRVSWKIAGPFVKCKIRNTSPQKWNKPRHTGWYHWRRGTGARSRAQPRTRVHVYRDMQTENGGVDREWHSGVGGLRIRGYGDPCTVMCLIYQHRYYYGSTRPELGILHTYGHLYLRDII